MNHPEKYGGVIVPMVTPFTSKGEIDEDAVCGIINHLCAGDAAGIFVLGTTGEAASINSMQKKKLVEMTASLTGGRTITYAGISDNCVGNSIEAAQTYFSFGVDAVVAHVPWYYPLSQDEIFRYFATLADNIDGPLMLYNIPKTTNISISKEVVEKLSRHPRIVGLKDSESTPSRMGKMIDRFAGKENFSYVMGCAALSVKALELGADGIVPSSANVVPEMYQQLYENTCNGKHAIAQKLQQETNQISLVYQKDRSLGQSLATLKMMMNILGLCDPTVLSPLETLNASQRTEIEKEMMKLDSFKTAMKA